MLFRKTLKHWNLYNSIHYNYSMSVIWSLEKKKKIKKTNQFHQCRCFVKLMEMYWTKTRCWYSNKFRNAKLQTNYSNFEVLCLSTLRQFSLQIAMVNIKLTMGRDMYGVYYVGNVSLEIIESNPFEQTQGALHVKHEKPCLLLLMSTSIVKMALVWVPLRAMFTAYAIKRVQLKLTPCKSFYVEADQISEIRMRNTIYSYWWIVKHSQKCFAVRPNEYSLL